MHDHTRDALALRELDQRGEMFHVGVHATGRDETQEMERPALASGGTRLTERRVLEEGAVVDRVADPHELLVADVAGAHGEMADLAVTHHSLRQPDGAAAGLERRVRIPLEERVETRGLRARHRIPRSIRRDPPSIEHAEHDRSVRRRHAKARTIAPNSSALSEAPPTSAPSIPSAVANSRAPAAVTLPP